MSHDTITLSKPPTHLDYSLVGEEASRAIERGLAEADWYQSPVPRAALRKLLERKDGPAIRDTALLFAILLLTGWATAALWGSWWAALPYFIYATFYGTGSDSRWHECGHGTAFKTDWMNSVLYEIASFMVMRESIVWRWSHTRHHSDTIIVGRDPEIQVTRPTNLLEHVLSLVNAGGYRSFFPKLLLHASGRISAEEKTFIPENEFSRVYLRARIYLAIYVVVIAAAIALQSWVPVFLFVLPQFFGTWLMILQNTPQHAGLAENVLDHRLNCRTVYMNPVSRFIYWNMNYHLEHHMYPLVPYHALAKLHEEIKDDCPPPYPSILSAWKEILPTLLRQAKDPAYHVKRKLPSKKELVPDGLRSQEIKPDADGWIEVCAATDLDREDVIRFDHGRKTFALVRDASGNLHATDGICTHGNNHLAEGLVVGGTIECPKHNGRFNLADGSPARAPICRGLATYPLEERAGRLWLNIARAGGCGARQPKTQRFRVVSNANVATFIKELVLEPVDASQNIAFEPGDYLQFDIPAFEEIRFQDFDIPEPYATVWRNQHVFDLIASNPDGGQRNNYSIASNRNVENMMRFNIRIATPPPGQDCPPGVGSSYMFHLKPGDEITAIGSFGEFHIKPTQKEMVYIGGGAGMAPLRAHLSHLFETAKTARRVSYWYGARSGQELFYQEYFERLAANHPNFQFYPALSSPLPEDEWSGHSGFIHEVVLDHYLASHDNPRAIEFYLCGPPAMIKACTKMLDGLGVSASQIAFDEF
jgi:Na+-transporting NADH:ubiquinone oxidoreductase subunit F